MFCRLLKRVRIALGGIVAALMISHSTGAHPRNGIEEPDRVAGPLLSALAKQFAGEYAAARDILAKALLETPESGPLLNALGSVQQDLGEYVDAERSYLRALKVCAPSDSDPERIVVMNNLGTLYLDTNQYSKGERVREQLENLPPETLERQPIDRARLLEVIASLEHGRNRDNEAERYYTFALQLYRQAEGPASADAASIEGNLGFLRLESQRYESAERFFRQAIREIETAMGPEYRLLIRPLINLARCENMLSRPNEAEPLARRAVELSGKILGQEHPVTATAMLEQAATLRALRRKAEARKLEKRAQAVLRNTSAAGLDRYTVALRELAPHTKR